MLCHLPMTICLLSFAVRRLRRRVSLSIGKWKMTIGNWQSIIFLLEGQAESNSGAADSLLWAQLFPKRGLKRFEITGRVG